LGVFEKGVSGRKIRGKKRVRGRADL